MKTIVTHHAPDLDAITAAWIIKRFLPNWQDASIAYVPAGQTLRNEMVDSDPAILHVDTGFGVLDHHQTNEFTCAAIKAYNYVNKTISQQNSWNNEALVRMAETANFFDHFHDATLPDAKADYHLFSAVYIIDGLKHIFPDNDDKITEFGFVMLDGLYKVFQEVAWGESILEKDGVEFTTVWGKGIGCETLNDAVLKVAAKSGYVVVVRKDPNKGYVRIKGMPGTDVDFTSTYEVLKQKDPHATWFLHSSKKILLNGTTKNPDMRPTKLTLNEIIEVLKKE